MQPFAHHHHYHYYRFAKASISPSRSSSHTFLLPVFFSLDMAHRLTSFEIPFKASIFRETHDDDERE